MTWLIPGCGKKSTETVYAIFPDSTAASEGGRLASFLTPSEAAVIMSEWMTSAGLDKRQYASELFKAIHDSLDQRNPGAGKAFDRSLDSVFLLLPDSLQAKMLVLSASPERVAEVLNTQSMKIDLTGNVENIYKSDSILLKRFRRALKNK